MFDAISLGSESVDRLFCIFLKQENVSVILANLSARPDSKLFDNAFLSQDPIYKFNVIFDLLLLYHAVKCFILHPTQISSNPVHPSI